MKILTFKKMMQATENYSKGIWGILKVTGKMKEKTFLKMWEGNIAILLQHIEAVTGLGSSIVTASTIIFSDEYFFNGQMLPLLEQDQNDCVAFLPAYVYATATACKKDIEIFAIKVSPNGRNYKHIDTVYTPWITTVVSVTDTEQRCLVVV